MTATVFPDVMSSFVPAVCPPDLGLDLSPIVLREVPTENGGVLRFREPLVLTPTQIGDSQYMSVENYELGIDVYGETQEELWDVIVADVTLLWHDVALASDDRLGKYFLEVKKNLLAAIEEVGCGRA
ncbi:MAG: hypothetical protein ACRC46_08330 [Thermoguttaceae bacterium]